MATTPLLLSHHVEVQGMGEVDPGVGTQVELGEGGADREGSRRWGRDDG